MELLVYFLILLSSGFLVYVLYESIFHNTQIMKERLKQLKILSDLDGKEDELKQPFIQRVIKPGYQKAVKTIGKVTPRSIKDKYNTLIKTSGTSQKTTVSNLVMIQIMLGFVQGGTLYILMKYTAMELVVGRVFLAGLLGFLLPIVYLYTKADKRKEKIRRSLPDLLDLVYISVEAGLAFDAALKKSAEKMKGPLSQEIVRTMSEITKGKDRDEAFKELYFRTGVEDISTLVRAIIQTEKLGSNISNMLRTQSNTMRQKRRQRAEERAAKIPIQMLFPLIFLMFPALFVVILGPAIINIIESLGSL